MPYRAVWWWRALFGVDLFHVRTANTYTSGSTSLFKPAFVEVRTLRHGLYDLLLVPTELPPSRCASSMLFSGLLFLLPLSHAQCYWRNGIANPDSNKNDAIYRTCSTDPTDALFRVCCATHDKCLRNGLCQSKHTGYFWREPCSSKKWENGACQYLCSNEVCCFSR